MARINGAKHADVADVEARLLDTSMSVAGELAPGQGAAAVGVTVEETPGPACLASG